jgi:hypothetical protein
VDPFLHLPSFSFKVFTVEQFLNYPSMILSYRMPYPLQSFLTLVTVWNCRNGMVPRTTLDYGEWSGCVEQTRITETWGKMGLRERGRFWTPTLPPSFKIHFWALGISTMPWQPTCGWVTVRVYPRVYNFQRLASTFVPVFHRLFSELRWKGVAEHAWAEGTAWEICA